MEDYKGLKIPEKITIVEKPIATTSWRSKREIPQGYVVVAGDTKALEHAHNWAEVSPGEWKDGKWITHTAVPGVDHTYENGKFKMTVKDSADDSWQGGKLSFWTCEIEAPDGKRFDIGINSDYLCETILHNTLINGTVQEEVYLGKVHGNTMAVTKYQPSFEQAIRDENKRNTKQTNKYTPGDIVRTLTSSEVYLGPWYELYNLTCTETRGYSYWGRTRKDEVLYEVTLYNKAKERHVFMSCKETNGKIELYHSFVDIKNTKPKRIVNGEPKYSGVSSMYQKIMTSLVNPDKDKSERYYLSGQDYHLTGAAQVLRYSDKADAKADVLAIIEQIKLKIREWDHAGTIRILNEAGEVLQEIRYA